LPLRRAEGDGAGRAGTDLADPDFGEPAISWFVERQCPWVRIETGGPLREG
jgi:hypothetical protein